MWPASCPVTHADAAPHVHPQLQVLASTQPSSRHSSRHRYAHATPVQPVFATARGSRHRPCGCVVPAHRLVVAIAGQRACPLVVPPIASVSAAATAAYGGLYGLLCSAVRSTVIVRQVRVRGYWEWVPRGKLVGREHSTGRGVRYGRGIWMEGGRMDGCGCRRDTSSLASQGQSKGTGGTYRWIRKGRATQSERSRSASRAL